MPSWLYVEVDDLVGSWNLATGGGDTGVPVSVSAAAVKPITIPPYAQHVHLCSFHVRQWCGDVGLDPTSLVAKRVEERVANKLRAVLLSRVEYSLEEEEEEYRYSPSAADKPRSSLESSAMEGVKVPLHLSILCNQSQVLATAARLYLHHISSYETTVLQPWQQQVEEMRRHHEQEMDELLSSTSGGCIDQQASNQGIVVESALLHALVDRHEQQLTTMQSDLAFLRRDVYRKASVEFRQFLSTAAMDILQSESFNLKAQQRLTSPLGNSGNEPTSPPNTHSSASIDSFLPEHIPVEFLKVTNPFQMACAKTTKDPMISSLVFGVSPLSRLVPCLALCSQVTRQLQPQHQFGFSDSAMENDGYVPKVEQHFQRLGTNHHSGVAFIGHWQEYHAFVADYNQIALDFVSHAPSEILSEYSESTVEVVEGRPLSMRLATNMWGGSIQWHVDPSHVVLGPEAVSMASERTEGVDAEEGRSQQQDEDDNQTYEQLLLAIIQHAIAMNVDMLTFVLLPCGDRRQRSYLFHPFFRGLVGALATAQLSFGGSRQPTGAVIAPLMTQGAIKATDISWAPSSVEHIKQRANYNFAMRTRVFVPDTALHVAKSVFGPAEVEVLR